MAPKSSSSTDSDWDPLLRQTYEQESSDLSNPPAYMLEDLPTGSAAPPPSPAGERAWPPLPGPTAGQTTEATINGATTTVAAAVSASIPTEATPSPRRAAEGSGSDIERQSSGIKPPIDGRKVVFFIGVTIIMASLVGFLIVMLVFTLIRLSPFVHDSIDAGD